MDAHTIGTLRWAEVQKSIRGSGGDDNGGIDAAVVKFGLRSGLHPGSRLRGKADVAARHGASRLAAQPERPIRAPAG